jgi:hypothetical protein
MVSLILPLRINQNFRPACHVRLSNCRLKTQAKNTCRIWNSSEILTGLVRQYSLIANQLNPEQQLKSEDIRGMLHAGCCMPHTVYRVSEAEEDVGKKC